MTATATEPLREPASAAEPPDHEIAIIGAGLSGLGMAIELERAGFGDYVIFERASEVGGTWRDNTYPGVGVDIPAQAYQFTYELKPDWSAVYAKGKEVQDYVLDLTERYGLRPRIRFDCQVRARVWDVEAQLWRLDTPDGEVTARYVISAIGPFVDPKPVGIPGLEAFQGKVIQSSRWDHSCDLSGKRAAIVGTGASAVQIIPKVAREVARLDVYQRTPIWVAPKLNPRFPGWLQALFRRMPLLQRLVRDASSLAAELVLVSMVVHHRRIPFLAHGVASLLRRVWYRSQVPDPELRAKLTPGYGFGCKRPAVSSTYLRAFTRDNVELITDPIERVTATGIATAGGRHREVDVLILATGFRLATDPENFRRTPVRGRDGFDLARFYEDNRSLSYEGITMPMLPNHFMLFGPYGFIGGTWHELVETGAAHVVRVLREARARGATEVEVRPEAAERWTEFVRDRLADSLWQHNACELSNSYYFDRHGDTPFLRPTSSIQARRASRRFPIEDYAFTNGQRVPTEI